MLLAPWIIAWSAADGQDRAAHAGLLAVAAAGFVWLLIFRRRQAPWFSPFGELLEMAVGAVAWVVSLLLMALLAVVLAPIWLPALLLDLRAHDKNTERGRDPSPSDRW